MSRQVMRRHLALRSASATRRRQGGYGEEFFLLFIAGIGLIFLLVYGLALLLGKGVKGKLIGLCVATALLSPLWFPVANSMWRQQQRDAYKGDAKTVCEQELARTPDAFAVDSLLDEAGGLAADDIIHLLTRVRLRFVEIKLNDTGQLTAYRNQSGANWQAAQSSGFAHLELGEANSPDCFNSSKDYPDHFFTYSPPVKPHACLKVTYGQTPRATHTLAEAPGRRGNLSTWTLTDRTTGQEVAAVSDAFKALRGAETYPPRWDRNSNRVKEMRLWHGRLWRSS